MTEPSALELAERIETNPLGWLPIVGDVINVTFTPEEARLLVAALRDHPAQGEQVARVHANDCSIYQPEQPCDCEGAQSGPGWVDRTDEEQIEALNSRVVEVTRQRDALAEVLKEAVLQLEYMQERMPTGTGAAVLARSHSALAKVLR